MWNVNYPGKKQCKTSVSTVAAAETQRRFEPDACRVLDDKAAIVLSRVYKYTICLTVFVWLRVKLLLIAITKVFQMQKTLWKTLL